MIGPRRLDSREAVGLIKAHYQGCGAGAGGCMHVQLDDGNLEDVFFRDESEDWVKQCGCDSGLVVFSALRVMRHTARRKARALALHG